MTIADEFINSFIELERNFKFKRENEIYEQIEEFNQRAETYGMKKK